MGQDTLYQIASWLLPLVFAIVLHEISHGWVAYAFGDPTAKQLGRLSPNPFRHVDPVGTVALPLVLAIAGGPIFGWARPVPVRADRLRHPRWQMMLVALAGPGMNLLLALISALLLAVLNTASPFLVANLANFLVINVFLAVFNLLPMPPFDGGHVVEALLPRGLVPGYRRIARFGMPLVIFLLVILPMVDAKLNPFRFIVFPIFRWVLGFFLHVSGPI
jgi:Zn-dependent protease